MRIYLRSDNSKNASTLEGEVLKDDGGSAALIKLDNRSRPLNFHKGHIFVKKHTPAWEEITGNKGIKVTLETVSEISEEESPVAERTRNKVKKTVNEEGPREYFAIQASEAREHHVNTPDRKFPDPRTHATSNINPEKTGAKKQKSEEPKAKETVTRQVKRYIADKLDRIRAPENANIPKTLTKIILWGLYLLILFLPNIPRKS